MTLARLLFSSFFLRPSPILLFLFLRPWFSASDAHQNHEGDRARTIAHQRRRQQARELHEGATIATVRTRAQTTRETATAAHALEPRGKKPVKIGKNTD